MQASLDRDLPGRETDDPRLMSRALGAMLLCAGLALLAGTALSPPGHANVAGMQAVGSIAVVVGGGALLWARHARIWTAHALFAGGAGLICLGTYFTGAATGLYAILLIWLAIFAATSFSWRAMAAHIGAIMLASGATLAMVGPSPGPPAVARWAVGGILLTLAATIMGRIAARRRASETFLRAQIEDRARLQRELEHLADHDPLTGVANRRRLEQDLARELARARREGAPLCVTTIDLDGLKEHNDTYGHAAGDRLLEHVATTWAAALRATDTIARTGGDEFVLLLPDCPLGTAERLVEELRQAVADTCSCSAGAAVWDGRESAADLQVRADLAMYEAKARLRTSPSGRVGIGRDEGAGAELHAQAIPRALEHRRAGQDRPRCARA
ncbi:MAG TPA: diguanylate cyclase [Thermoleophilaceae bacterium]|nr:diguanylate cyclase [Thermoleophilaceae bacterium]